MLCLTTTGSTLEENRLQVESVKDHIDLVELRIDCLDSEEAKKADTFKDMVNMPIILTCRRKIDGGEYNKSERQRLQLVKHLALSGKFDYVDLEEDLKRGEFEKKASEINLTIIRSFHDLKGTGSDLLAKVNKIDRKGEIPKMALTPLNTQDLLKIFAAGQMLSHIKKKIIVGMGDMGIPTRILYKKTGSMLMYCTCKKNGDEKLCHLNAKVMDTLYKSRNINDNTRIYGIIGNPVKHSMSPMIHNPGFQDIHFNAVYVPFKVDDVRHFFKLAEYLKISGFSITVPHKRTVIPYLGLINREVKLIGSCNTIVRSRNQWKGINTDYYGFLEPIKDELEKNKITKALVIGAGGASRAVVWALRSNNVKVTIVNRDVLKAKNLAQETMSNFDSLENANKYSNCDLIVQTTVVGMTPDISGNILPSFEFNENQIVYDLVYTPKLTRFLLNAKQANAKLVYGWDMLLAQAKLQFEAFSGYHYPKTTNIYELDF